MESCLIHDRGRGPELVGTRITVYNLLPHLLDPTATEAQVCGMYDLSPEQVAAARAYILTHYDDVMREHSRIEQALRQGNPAAVLDATRQVRGRLKSFREWMAARGADSAESMDGSAPTPAARLRSFREWLAERETAQQREG